MNETSYDIYKREIKNLMKLVRFWEKYSSNSSELTDALNNGALDDPDYFNS